VEENIEFIYDNFLYSNNIPYKTFNKKRETLSPYKKNNHAFAYSKKELSYNSKNYSFGFTHKKEMDIFINDGFVETWFYANYDFSYLLNSNTIGNNITPKDIKGDGVYYDLQGLFYTQKNYYKSFQYNIRYNFYYGNEYHNIKTRGSNYNNFLLALDYYYTKENKITQNNPDNDFSIYGYGLDLEFIYKKNKHTINSTLYNLISKLYLYNISYMHYDFNSVQIYLGEDGYNHFRPFGQGYYKDNITIKQNLIPFMITSYNYQYTKRFGVGFNGFVKKDLSSIEPKVNYKFKNFLLDLGYHYKSKITTFGAQYKGFALKLSNNFDTNTYFIQASCTISFKI
jgi:hypothetical protein